jgi:hypothetical protein
VAEGIADILGTQPKSNTSSGGAIPKRIIDRLDSRLVNVLTVIGFAAPVFGYLWMLHRYSVNVIVADQWDDLTVIGNSYTHSFDWGSLWAQHNENRIFFPNLIVLLLSRTTHFNIRVEENLSAVMLVVAVFLLIWAHKRRSPETPWLYYCPVAILGFSVVQYENTLWGFQMAWYLVLLSLAVAIIVLDRFALNWPLFLTATAVAVVGSFSSLQGLLIWPAGLVLLFHRRRPVSFIVAWIVAALASVVLYFYNFNQNIAQPDHNYAFHHPIVAIKFLLFAVGDVAGKPIPFQGPINYAVVLFGLVIVVLAVGVLVVYGMPRDENSGSPIGIALIIFGLLFAMTVTLGRVDLGYWVASGSRYTTFDLLTLIGIAMTILCRPASAVVLGGQGANVSDQVRERSRSEARRGSTRWRTRLIRPEVRWVVAIVIAIQIAFGIHYGIEGARSDYAYQVRAAQVLRNINQNSDNTVRQSLYLFNSAPFIRHQAEIAMIHHLSVFATG